MNMSDKSPRFIARHRLTCHAMREIMWIEKRHLDMAQASVINSPARLRVAKRYIAHCPFDFCGNAADLQRKVSSPKTIMARKASGCTRAMWGVV
jgi:hypothetical protein